MTSTQPSRLARRIQPLRIATWMLAVTLGGCSPGEERPAAAAPAGPNVVIIVVDTLRADHLSLYGYGRETSPNLDRLAHESVVFENATTVMSHTLPAHISLVTGVHPATHQVLSNGWTYAGPYLTLAERLKSAGYSTAAFVSGFPLSRASGFDRGFELYEETPPGRGGMPASKRDGEVTNDAVLRWLEDGSGQPFFLLVHYFDTHVPYTTPPGGGETFQVDEPLWEHLREIGAAERVMGEVSHQPVTLDGSELSLVDAVNTYDNQIYRVDHNVGELVDALRVRGLLDETLLVLLSDHGQGLGQHRYYSHGLYLYEEQLRIPLLLRPPAGLDWEPGRITTAVSLLDVVPTVLEVVGLPDSGLLQGHSLRGPTLGESSPPRELLAQRRYFSSASQSKRERFAADQTLHAVRGDSPLKYLRGGDGTEELFDLSADPRETINLVRERPAELARLRKRLDQLRDERAQGEALVEQEIDPETRRALEALGYTQ